VTERESSLLPLGSPEFWTRAAGTVLTAVRKSRVSIAVFALVFIAAGVVAARMTPQAFSTDARLLVRRTDVMPALAHPRRSVPMGSDSLTQSAGDFVRDRQALRAIVEHYDLLTRWQRDRAPMLKLKDAVTEKLSGPMSEADRIEALVDVLARRIQVTVDGEVITVGARWSDAATTVDLVEGATEAFLQARRRIDIDAIADTHALLARSVEAARIEVEQHVAATRLLTRSRPTAVVPASLVGDPALGSIDAIDAMSTEVAAAEEVADTLAAAHDASVRALETRLADRLARATDKHPDVIALRRQLEQARVVPASVVQARTAADAVRAEANWDARRRPSSPTPTLRPVAAVAGTAAVEDEGTLYARSLLESSIASYQDLLDRLSNTRIELETARAAFDYRYRTISGARLPNRPDSSSGLVLIVGALFAGLMAGAGLAVVREVRQ